MNYEDGYDDGFEAGKKAQKQAASTWNGWPNLTETAFAVSSQIMTDGYPLQVCATNVQRGSEGGSVTIVLPHGQTLLTVSSNADADIDLNTFDWTDVQAAGGGSNRSLVSGADYIQFRDQDNHLIQYYYANNGEKWGMQTRQAARYPELVAGGKAIVPAGTAFWYYRAPDSSASVTIS